MHIQYWAHELAEHKLLSLSFTLSWILINNSQNATLKRVAQAST